MHRGLFLLLVAVQASPSAHASPSIDLRRIVPIAGDPVAGKDKATLCSACHGADGVAPVPMFPNLAGQRADYLYWRLVAFKRAGRPDSPMTPMVAALDDATLRDLAAWFASLPPARTAPAVMNDTRLRGRALFLEGDAAAGVPPCQGCHGASAQGSPDAERVPRRRVYPALRGQHATYIEQRLGDLARDVAPATTSGQVMAPVARSLDAASVAAVAAWLDAGAP